MKTSKLGHYVGQTIELDSTISLVYSDSLMKIPTADFHVTGIGDYKIGDNKIESTYIEGNDGSNFMLINDLSDSHLYLYRMVFETTDLTQNPISRDEPLTMDSGSGTNLVYEILSDPIPTVEDIVKSKETLHQRNLLRVYSRNLKRENEFAYVVMVHGKKMQYYVGLTILPNQIRVPSKASI